MSNTSTQPSHERRRRRQWATWLLLAVAIGAIAFIGGGLMGLAPWYTAMIVGGILVVALALTLWRQRSRTDEAQFGLRRLLPLFLIAGCVTFGAIQLIPYGRDHANPPPTGEPDWSSPRTRELMVNACYGCHSNEVEWPGYSNIAPISWAITDHVEEGRDAVNYSEFATNPGEADETIEVIEEGSMPPAYYTLFGLHSQANLSNVEIAELIAGLQATPGLSDSETQTEGAGTDSDDDRDED
ncbi:MAG TPA: heme-binding domain-containing protein [Ilumatobacteraceae bacterium]|nr:heme-binding domain-containing protein [Ilumatobacteraceae bacterium]